MFKLNESSYTSRKNLLLLFILNWLLALCSQISIIIIIIVIELFEHSILICHRIVDPNYSHTLELGAANLYIITLIPKQILTNKHLFIPDSIWNYFVYLTLHLLLEFASIVKYQEPMPNHFSVVVVVSWWPTAAETVRSETGIATSTSVRNFQELEARTFSMPPNPGRSIWLIWEREQLVYLKEVTLDMRGQYSPILGCGKLVMSLNKIVSRILYVTMSPTAVKSVPRLTSIIEWFAVILVSSFLNKVRVQCTFPIPWLLCMLFNQSITTGSAIPLIDYDILNVHIVTSNPVLDQHICTNKLVPYFILH